jgi:hypothetical protein
VITRSNNRDVIESELVRSPHPSMNLVYVDLPRWARSWKRGQRGVRLYYFLWQVAALRRAKAVHKTVRSDPPRNIRLLFPAADEDALRRAIERLLDQSECERMGEGGFEMWNEHYRPERALKELEESYMSAISAGAARADGS